MYTTKEDAMKHGKKDEEKNSNHISNRHTAFVLDCMFYDMEIE